MQVVRLPSRKRIVGPVEERQLAVETGLRFVLLDGLLLFFDPPHGPQETGRLHHQRKNPIVARRRVREHRQRGEPFLDLGHLGRVYVQSAQPPVRAWNGRSRSAH